MSKSKKKGVIYDAEKERADRVAQSQVVFDEFAVNANIVDTVVLLLQSNEDSIILKSFHHLDKFAMKFIGNYTVLYERKIIEAIFRHIESPQRFIRRFAFKILSQLFIVPEAKEELLVHMDCFKIAFKNFMEVSFTFTLFHISNNFFNFSD